MARETRSFTDYEAALGLFLEEEIGGKAYFARLAEFFDGRRRHALQRIARMEEVTAAAFAPVLERHGVAWPDAEAAWADGLAEAEAKAAWSWRELMREMAYDYDAYLEEFESVAALAPPEDAAFHRFLLRHEEAMIEFAKRELEGDPQSLQPIEDFLAAEEERAPG